jgi:hypothetical protein
VPPPAPCDMNRPSRPDQVSIRFCGPLTGLLAFGAWSPRAAAAQSPSIDVLGSYFPAWLLCIVVGVILTIFARLLFVAWKIDAHLISRPIVYPCLTVVFAMSVWLLFFRN